MIKTLISILLFISALTVSGQKNKFNYSKDFNSILVQSKDSTSNLFYPKLLERFKKNDSTLTNKEVLSLMIGFTGNENYKPYQNIDKEREILNLINEKKYEDALIKCNALLESNPLNFIALMEKGFALWKLENERSEFYKSQYFKVLKAVLYSGDGSDKNPLFVLGPIDGQIIIRYVWQGSIGKMGSGRDKNGNFLDMLEMNKDGGSTTVYFNIQHALDNSETKKQIDSAIEEKNKN